MKKTVLGLTLAAFTATTATAGSLSDPIVEEDLVAAQTASSSAPDAALVMFFLTAVVILAAASSSANLNVSDARLKQDITRIGAAPNGLPLYHFRYAGQSQVYQGVMAQDVLKHDPQAVVRLPGGYFAVDYDQLGLEMTEVH